MVILTVCGKDYSVVRLLGHGKGGYSYLTECGENLLSWNWLRQKVYEKSVKCKSCGID